jgi:hypothetical protein
VDWVVRNAYFSRRQSGGFRMWWELYGSDDNLDDNHLVRMDGRFRGASVPGLKPTSSGWSMVAW